MVRGTDVLAPDETAIARLLRLSLQEPGKAGDLVMSHAIAVDVAVCTYP